MRAARFVKTTKRILPAPCFAERPQSVLALRSRSRVHEKSGIIEDLFNLMNRNAVLIPDMVGVRLVPIEPFIAHQYTPS